MNLNISDAFEFIAVTIIIDFQTGRFDQRSLLKLAL